MPKRSTSNCYIIDFDTEKFTTNELNRLAKIGSGFLSPKHDQDYAKFGDTKFMKPYYEILIHFKKPITNAECRKRLKDCKVIYKIRHVNKALDIQSGTVSICHCYHNHNKKNHGYYDKFNLKWFGQAKEPDYRLWFWYRTYTKSGLKRSRSWTDKCLKNLPEPTDLKQTGMYKSNIYPAWNQYVIEDLEQKEPIKSILAKKNSKTYQQKIEHAAQKRQQTIKHRQQQAAQQYDQHILELANDLTSFQQQLALNLSRLTILNHLAKYLNDWSHNDNPSKQYNNLITTYNGKQIYNLKTKFIYYLFKHYPNLIQTTFYKPDNPDKVIVNLCSDHYDEAHELGIYIPDYIDEFYSTIQKCPRCQINRYLNYYTCYNFAINLNQDLKFDYHIPYPIGHHFFPNLGHLKQIYQVPNEMGPYLFGHESDTDELHYCLQANRYEQVKEYLSSLQQNSIQ